MGVQKNDRNRGRADQVGFGHELLIALLRAAIGIIALMLLTVCVAVTLASLPLKAIFRQVHAMRRVRSLAPAGYPR